MASGIGRAPFLLLAAWLLLPAAMGWAEPLCGREVSETFKRAAAEFAPVLNDFNQRIQRLQRQGDSRDVDARLRSIRALQRDYLPLLARRNRVLDLMLCTTLCPCAREDVPTFVRQHNAWVRQIGRPRYGFHEIVLPSAPPPSTVNAPIAPPAASTPLPDPNFVRARPRPASQQRSDGQAPLVSPR